MIDAARLLDMKIIGTEHFPDASGNTVPELQMNSDIPVFEKTKVTFC